VKGIGATAAGGVALSIDDGPVQQTEAAVIVAGAVVGGLIVGAAATAAYGKVLGDGVSEEFSSAVGYQKHVDEFTREVETSLSEDLHRDSLQRDIQFIARKAREEAIFRIYEEGVDYGDTTTATNAAETAINEAFAVVEKSILQRWNIQYARANILDTMFSDMDEWGGIGTGGGNNPLVWIGSGDIQQYNEGYHTTLVASEGTHTLCNGQEFTYSKWVGDDGAASNGTPNHTYEITPFGPGNPYNEYRLEGVDFRAPDAADYGADPVDLPDETRINLLDGNTTATLLNDLQAEYDAMMGEVDSMVNTYFQPAQDGEIDLTDAVGPAHLSNTAETAKDYQEAAMALRSMGLPLSEQVATISLATDQTDEEGNTVRKQFTGRLSWTAHNGNTLPVGAPLTPSNFPGSIYAAVNVEEEVDDGEGGTTTETRGEIYEVTDDFIIESAEGTSDVSFEDRSVVESDSDLTNEEINQIYKENYTANKEATENVHDTATGGGGGWSGLSTEGKTIIVAVLGLLGFGAVNS